MPEYFKSLALMVGSLVLAVPADRAGAGDVGGQVQLYPGDGSDKAPGNAGHLPTLLDGYAARPPWRVAGVDYAVGYRKESALNDPSSLSVAGVAVDKSRRLVVITGRNVRLAGYDFSLDGGWGVSVSTAANVTIENNKFVVGKNGNTPIYVSPDAEEVTIQNNLIDGAGSPVQILVDANGAGATTLQYNLIQNAWSRNLVMSSHHGGERWTVRYNLIANAGLGFANGAHGDWIQTYNIPEKNTDSLDLSFNTFVQSVPIKQGRTQGVSAFSANSGPSSGGVQTVLLDNNCFIANNGSYVNFAIILDTTRLIGSASIRNNYFDTSNIGSANGGGGSWEFVGNYNGANGGPYRGKVSQSGNINMLTGALFAQRGTVAK